MDPRYKFHATRMTGEVLLGLQARAATKLPLKYNVRTVVGIDGSMLSIPEQFDASFS